MKMWTTRHESQLRLAAALLAALLGGATGALAARLLSEGLFPRALWLNGVAPVTALALLGAALAAAFVWRRGAEAVVPLLPLLLLVPSLGDATVELLRSRLLLYGALWLSTVLGVHLLWRPRGRTGRFADLILLLALMLPLYALTMGRTVGEADTFEFQVVIPRLGIVHPTGYPLYLLLGKLFSLIPLGPVAWRINLASVTFGVVALVLVYLLVERISRGADRIAGARSGARLAALLTAVLLGTRPTFWRQALEAEVYPLHALVVAGGLLLMLRLLDAATVTERRTRLLLLAFWLGLGLTNHLTTVFLIPPAAVAVALAMVDRRRRTANRRSGLLSAVGGPRSAVAAAIAASAPLLLYLYLPLRWPAVNGGEPMGWGRFVDWVVGGRFQDALQWQAFLRDPARYEVVGRLFRAEWGDGRWLIPIALFALVLWLLRRRAALLLTLAWAGFTFYCLNYYVPDLEVFLLPAQLVMAVALGAGVGALLSGEVSVAGRRLRIDALSRAALLGWTGLLLALVLWAAPATWERVDRSDRDGGLTWGRAVLNQPLPENSLILADSEKIAPLYYLQQAEGIRPDLEIAVLFTEAEYRARLGAAIAEGQDIYLARFLPGLEGQYHLRSAGPLTEVGTEPLEEVPAAAAPASLSFDDDGSAVEIAAYELEIEASPRPEAAALTLYWRAPEGVTEDWRVYVRWATPNGEPVPGQPAPVGRHPANDYYPFRAWEPGEVVVDYHLLDRPVLAAPRQLALQVAVGPPFSPAEELDWQSVTNLTAPATPPRDLPRAIRQQVGAQLLDGVSLPETVRPGTPVSLLLSGCGTAPEEIAFTLQRPSVDPEPADQVPAAACEDRFMLSAAVPTVDEGGEFLGTGRYEIVARAPYRPGARCGWLRTPTDGCVLGTLLVSGVPLPDGAVNFDDKIALLEVETPEKRLTPGGTLPVTARWTALAPLDENYTVFIQVLDARDRIVGQVDSWPLQGTFPTAAWTPGQTVQDPYQVRLDAELPPGDYRLIVGWYLLGSPPTRLPVVDSTGAPVDDQVVVTGFRR